MTATGRRTGAARSRALLALVLGTSAVAVAAAPAAAAPPWSVPATVPVSAPGFFPTGFVGSASGTALLHGTTSSRPSTYTDALVWLGPDGTILHEQVLSRRLAAAPLEVTADRFAVLTMRGPDATHMRERLDLGFVRTGGIVRRFVMVARFVPTRDGAGGVNPAAIAADRRGDVAVAWSETRAPTRTRSVYDQPTSVRLVIRRRSGRLSKPRTIARLPASGAGPVALAFDQRGRLVVAYGALARQARRGASVTVRTLDPRGRLSRPQKIGVADPSWGTDLRAASGADGTVAIAYGSRVAEECPTGRKVVQAAVRPAGRRAFQRATTLATSPVTSCESRTVDVVVGPDGRTTVAWSLFEAADRRVVRVATFDPAGRLISNEPLGTGDFGDLVQAPDGAVLATWDNSADPASFGNEGPWGGHGPEGVTQGHALAALRPAGDERFGPPELVSDDRDDTGPPIAALDPRNSRFELLWFGYRLDEQPPAPPLVGALRTAGRSTRDPSTG